MNYFYYTYLTVVIACLIVSIFLKQNHRSKIWVYFAVVVLVDIYMLLLYPKTNINIHPEAIAFYTLFFINYYKNSSTKKKNYNYFFLFILIISSSIILTSREIYDLKLIILMAFVYITLPLIWMVNQIINADENPVTSKQTFWVSFSLLMWIIFFIFKMIPLYFLDLHDKEFLITIDMIFQTVNIMSYILLLRSLFCKI